MARSEIHVDLRGRYPWGHCAKGSEVRVRLRVGSQALMLEIARAMILAVEKDALHVSA